MVTAMNPQLRTILLLGSVFWLSLAGCGGGAKNDASARRLLANPYNPKVRGNVYSSKWKDMELSFSTRVWRVEKGRHALHLVGRDKFSQVILGSDWQLFGGAGSLGAEAEKVLHRLGIREFEIISEHAEELHTLEGLVMTLAGVVPIDKKKSFSVRRRVQLHLARSGRRTYWMAFVSTEEAFEGLLPEVAQLKAQLIILSQYADRDASANGRSGRGAPSHAS